MYVKNRPGSITNTADIKSAYDIMFSVNKWRPLLESNRSKFNIYLLSYLGYQYLTALLIYGGVNRQSKSALYPILNNQKSIAKYVLGEKAKVSHLLISIFGIKFVSQVFNIVYRLK